MCYTDWLLVRVAVQHTSASLTINENYDSDVRDDTERFLNIVVPEVSWFSAYCNVTKPKEWSHSNLKLPYVYVGAICTLEAYIGRLVLGTNF